MIIKRTSHNVVVFIMVTCHASFPLVHSSMSHVAAKCSHFSQECIIRLHSCFVALHSFVYKYILIHILYVDQICIVEVWNQTKCIPHILRTFVK